MLASLLLAQGTPMLLAGDERGRTQAGNNNAYCQDNETGWIDWTPSERATSLTEFVRLLIRLRRAAPILHHGRFFTGEYNAALGVKDVTWLKASGGEMQPGDWHDAGMKCFGMLMDGRAQATGIRRPGNAPTLLLVTNAHHDAVTFTLPEHAGAGFWSLVFDTDTPEQRGAEVLPVGETYAVAGRSTVLLQLARSFLDPASGLARPDRRGV